MSQPQPSPSIPPATAVPAQASSDDGLYTPVFPAVLLQPLQEMGFDATRATRALHATGGESVDRALQWLFEHADDTNIDTPLRIPRPAAAATPAAPAASSNPASAAASSAPAQLTFTADTPLKLVLLVRTDLHMRSGKIAAQCAHAAVGIVLDLQQTSGKYAAPAVHQSLLRAWLHDGQAKVVLQVSSEADMLRLEELATSAGLPTHIVQDAGRTQVEAGSRTVLAIGPGPIQDIDKITGHLKLL